MKITRTIFGQKGEIGIIVVLTLSIIGTLGLLVVKGPDAVNKYNNSLNRIRNENPTNEDMQYVAENLASLTDAAGGLPIPTGADDVLVAALQALTSVSTEIGSKPIPQPGHPGQVSPCGITVDPILAAYGEHVMATITIPIAFQSGIKSITATAGAEGFNVPPTGGTFTFGIPCSAAEHFQVSFEAYDSQGAKVCSGSATVNIKPPLSTTLISPTLSTTLISPTGTINSSLPTYKWNAECVATLYYLLVDDSTGRGKIFTPYSASAAGCPLGIGTCSVTPSVSLADGNATWWVEPCTSGGCGAWSNALGFIVSTDPSQSWVAGYIIPPTHSFMVTPFVMEKYKFVPAADKEVLGEGLSKSLAIKNACLKFEYVSPWSMCCCYYYGQHNGYKICIDDSDWNRCK